MPKVSTSAGHAKGKHKPRVKKRWSCSPPKKNNKAKGFEEEMVKAEGGGGRKGKVKGMLQQRPLKESLQ